MSHETKERNIRLARSKGCGYGGAADLPRNRDQFAGQIRVAMAEDLLSIQIVSAALKIRPMAETDAVAVAELAGELDYPNETEAVRSRIRTIGDADLLLVTVDSNDRPVGFIQAHRVCIIEVGFRVEILGLVVSSTARRFGIARRLIAEVERWAKSIGVETVSVRSNVKRVEAHLFYPAMGYKKIKTQAVYEKKGASR